MKKIIKPLAVLVTSAAIVSLPILSASAATTDTVINAEIGSTITVSSLNTVNISVDPTDANGKISSGKDTVTVNTNNSTGYNLSLNMQTSSQNLVSGSNNITPTTKTTNTPGQLDQNSWGYRIDGAAFGTGTNVESNIASSSYSWAQVPVSGASNVIKTSNTTANNDTTDVFYAIRANSSLPSGTYSGTVTYTAVAK